MNNEFFMKKCLELASLSEGRVSPNPLVGCIIVNDNGEIIAQGRHEKYGEAHAEQNALKMAGSNAKNLTLFVNLEPCNHYGKTPPCAKLIAEAGIKKVVVGTRDLNQKAQGGIEYLLEQGVNVEVGILEEECRKLNEIFFFSLNIVYSGGYTNELYTNDGIWDKFYFFNDGFWSGVCLFL